MKFEIKSRFGGSIIFSIETENIKLAIEADGTSHHSIIRREQDQRKDALLRGLGWTVLRFTNDQIMNEAMTVAQEIWSTISKLKSITHT